MKILKKINIKFMNVFFNPRIVRICVLKLMNPTFLLSRRRVPAGLISTGKHPADPQGSCAHINWREKLLWEIKMPKLKAKVNGAPESKHKKTSITLRWRYCCRKWTPNDKCYLVASADRATDKKGMQSHIQLTLFPEKNAQLTESGSSSLISNLRQKKRSKF